MLFVNGTKCPGKGKSKVSPFLRVATVLVTLLRFGLGQLFLPL